MTADKNLVQMVPHDSNSVIPDHCDMPGLQPGQLWSILDRDLRRIRQTAKLPHPAIGGDFTLPMGTEVRDNSVIIDDRRLGTAADRRKLHTVQTNFANRRCRTPL
jgi:hypothetical protein